MLTVHFVLIFIAVILFAIAALGIATRVNLVALGLALFALSFLTGCAMNATYTDPQGATYHGSYTTPDPK